MPRSISIIATYPGSAGCTTGYSTNWYNQVLRNAFYQNHNLSISGGSTTDKYTLSASYQTNDGIIIFNNYTRYTVRLNNEFTPTTFLKIGTTASFANQTSQNVPTGRSPKMPIARRPCFRHVNGKFGNTSQYQNVGNPVLDAQNTNDLSHNNRSREMSMWKSDRSSHYRSAPLSTMKRIFRTIGHTPTSTPTTLPSLLPTVAPRARPAVT